MSSTSNNWEPQEYEQVVEEICARITDELTNAFTPFEMTLYLQHLFNSDEAPKIIATVHRGKKYEGNSGHQHTLDVSIEIVALGISFLIIVECKCYKSTVGIDDLLEFAARLDDLPVHKGIMITTVGFQEGAIKIAKANGIALITFNPKALIIHHGIDRTGFEIAPTYSDETSNLKLQSRTLWPILLDLVKEDIEND